MGVSFYQGRGAKVYIKPLPDGVETEPIEFTATLAGLYTNTVTITTAAAGDYGITVSSNSATYTAGASDTTADIAAGLAAAINADSDVGVYAAYPGTGAILSLYQSTTFTATASGTNSLNMTVGTVTATGTEAHPKGAGALVFSSALPSGAFLNRGEYLGFTNAAGLTILVQCQEQVASTGSTTAVKIENSVAAIDAGATASAPYRLGGRTSASIDRQGNRTTSVTFDDDAFERGLTTSLSSGLTLDGNWTPTDPGYRNAEFFFWGNEPTESAEAIEPLQQFYMWVEMPNTNKTLFSKGRVYKGPASISSMPLEIPSDGIISGNIEAAFNGRPTVVDELPL